jgi:hypothetical protein
MIDFEHIDWSRNSELRRLLETYCSLHEAARQRQAEFDGWLPRIRSLEGIADSDLPMLHGKLIALGFLKFQLVNRTAGMHYHVDPSGREALAHPDGVIADLCVGDSEDRNDSLAAA